MRSMAAMAAVTAVAIVTCHQSSIAVLIQHVREDQQTVGRRNILYWGIPQCRSVCLNILFADADARCHKTGKQKKSVNNLPHSPSFSSGWIWSSGNETDVLKKPEQIFLLPHVPHWGG